MCDIKCPYLPCGQNENCKGCCNDPHHSTMTKEEFFDINIHLGCGDCKYCDPCADLDGITSKCKRLDHKHFQFAVPWFKSYDCGQHSHGICYDFKPKDWELWIKRHFKKEFLDNKDFKENQYVGICIDKNQKIRYYVSAKDFYYNTFLNSDGSLKWIKKMYYKKSTRSPIGYELITEWNKNEKKC